MSKLNEPAEQPDEPKLRRWAGQVTLIASVHLELDSLDEIEAEDEENAKEIMQNIALEVLNGGNYHIDSIQIEVTPIGEEPESESEDESED